MTRLYVEAFSGGLAVMLAKPRSTAEVINDINGDLVNLYRHAQFHIDALVAEVEFTLVSRQMAEFATRVQTLKGDWLVTVNDCPENR